MIIYAATSPSGKTYIGQTVQGLRRRWAQHSADSRRGVKSHFMNALRKHGPENFRTRVVWVCDSKEMLDLMETHFIEVCGDYNQREGGSHGRMSAESRAKISASKMGKPSPNKGKRGLFAHTEEHKRNLSKTMNGNQRAKGTVRTDREQISARMKKVWADRRDT